MVVVILLIKVDPTRRAEVLRLIRPIIGPTEAQPDCSLCRIYSETDDDDALLLLQEWRSEEGFERYIRSSEFKRILAAIDLGAESPKFSINRVLSRKGLEAAGTILSRK